MKNINKERLTTSQKNANNKQWYKDKARHYNGLAFTSDIFDGMVSEFQRKKVNMDLYNGIINIRDFEYVCKPFGGEVGELPANFSNKDICSTKIKVLEGMEASRPFGFKVTAVNEEATTRKEEEEFNRIRDFVIQETLSPIRAQIEMKYAEQSQGRQLTQEESAQIQQQIAKEMEVQTPDQIRKYMERKHQDPAEALNHQLLQYLIQKERIQDKFNKGFKYLLTAGDEVFHVGQKNGEPHMRVVNTLYFDYDKSPDIDWIEDGEWAAAEYQMTPSQIVAQFSDLTNEEIDEIYTNNHYGATLQDSDWTFLDNAQHNTTTIRVLHTQFKALRKLGFLKYVGMNGMEQETIVDETYKLDKNVGDISIEWKWIPETHEVWQIGSNIFQNMGPVPGQFKDLDNLYNCKLSYFGAAMDNLNSQTTSLMDRMKVYQYYYNIIMYRLELLMASDKGKIMLMNINAIPKSAGIDIEKWMYYAEALKIGWVNPQEEGNRGVDVTNMAKEINMSLISDIQKYVELARYIEERCGNSVGVTAAMEGQVAANEAVSNTRINIAQNTNVLEPIFQLHNNVKRNVLEALLEQAKISYSQYDGKKLSYILDDLSLKSFTINGMLLDNSTIGLFVTNSGKANEAIEFVKQLAHAAMQNATIDLSDVVKVIRTEGIQEAEESLVVAEAKKRAEAQEQQVAAIEAQGRNEEAAREWEREKMEFDRETDLILEDKKTERELSKQAMLSIGFNENKDVDGDGKLDVLEIYNQAKAEQLADREITLKERALVQKTQDDKEKNDIKRAEVAKKPSGGSSNK